LFRTPGALSLMIGFMERNPYAGACGGRLFYPDGRPQQSYGHFPSVLRTLAYLFPLYKLFPVRWFARVKRSNVVPDDAVRTPVRIDWPSGACLLARSSMIQGIGMLDERYFLYMEETDWCLRMKSCGWERYYLPGAELVHRFGGSPGNAGSAMLLRHLESLFIYYRTHFSRAARILVSAGYLVRAAWSTSFSTARHSVFSGHQKARADESARYWLLALRLSTDEFKNLVLDTLSSTKRAQRKGTARKRPA
jgi:GT2 family glycosyltransferase